MGAKNALPVEIVVYAKPDNNWATVKWEFSRQQIKHRFSMQMHNGSSPTPIKDNEFRVSVPSPKHRPNKDMPLYFEHVFKVAEHEYRAMIQSIIEIVRKHNMIEDAQTDVLGVARMRDPIFKYPTWRDQRLGYAPKVMREALLASTAFQTPKRAVKEFKASVPLVMPKPNMPLANGEDLPGPGKIETVTSLDVEGAFADIIEGSMPVEPTEDPYVTGINDLKVRITGQRGGIVGARDEFVRKGDKAKAKIYDGYAKMLARVLTFADDLIVMRLKAERDEAGMQKFAEDRDLI